MGSKPEQLTGRAELRTHLGADLLDQMVQQEIQDDRIVGKTWKVRHGTVRRVTELANQLGVNYGDLVDWMLNHMVEAVSSGTLEVPIGTITVPVIQGHNIHTTSSKGSQARTPRRQSNKSRTQK